MQDPRLAEAFQTEGRLWLRSALTVQDLQSLRSQCDMENRPGARIDHSNSLFQGIVTSALTATLASIWPHMRPVRVVSFNKTAESNWGVPWHQDRVIAVKKKCDVEGYSNWSMKNGVWHCEPPIDVLNRMLFVRIHLDRSTRENGAMEIALGSHRKLKVTSDQAASCAHEHVSELTFAEPGDVLVLNMLTLHRSLPAENQEGRMVIRVDYAAQPLPAPLEWAV